MEQKKKYICWLLGFKYMQTEIHDVNENAAAIQYAQWRKFPHSAEDADVIICVQSPDDTVRGYHVYAHVEVSYTSKYDPHIKAD